METPQMASSSYSSQVLDLNQFAGINAAGIIGQPLGVVHALQFPQSQTITPSTRSLKSCLPVALSKS